MSRLLHIIPGLKAYVNSRTDNDRLLQMPDYLLRDIGLTREQLIGNTRWHPFWDGHV